MTVPTKLSTRSLARRALQCAALTVAMVFMASTSHAALITIDFESYLEGDLAGTVGPATFSTSQVLTTGLVGGLLNESELLPFSGVNALVDYVVDLTTGDVLSGAPIEIVFSTPIISFSGYFTYSSGLTITAYTASNVLVDSATGAYTSNLVGSGEPGSVNNEPLGVSGLGIRRVLITGNPSGVSFSADDISFETDERTTGTTDTTGTAPEPASLLLLGSGLVVVAARLKALRSRA